MEFTPEALRLTPRIATRMFGILVADGFNYSESETVKVALTAAGAFVFTIDPRRLFVTPLSSGKGVAPEHHFEAFHSTGFDTVYIPGGAEHIASLRKNGRVTHWIWEAFRYLKATGATGEALELVRHACGVDGMLFSNSDNVVDSYAVVTAGAVEIGPSSLKESFEMMKEVKNFVDAYALTSHKIEATNRKWMDLRRWQHLKS